MEVEKVATTKAQQRAVNKYVRENYDKLLLTMPKGRKSEIKAIADAQGESVNGFLNRLIAEAMGSKGGERNGN